MARNKRSAFNKAMDFLARRDYSQKELAVKLLQDFDVDEVARALTKVKEHGWLLPPEELSEKVHREMHRKNKGFRYILNFLRKKGLPPVEMDFEAEMEKARYILSKHASDSSDRQKLYSLLNNRGFDKEIIREAVNETLRNS